MASRAAKNVVYEKMNRPDLMSAPVKVGPLKKVGKAAALGAKVIGKMVTRPFTNDDVKAILGKK